MPKEDESFLRIKRIDLQSQASYKSVPIVVIAARYILLNVLYHHVVLKCLRLVIM